MEREKTPYIVYVKVDADNRIVSVDSSAFINNTDGWTQIDSGYGYQYRLAQNNYFPRPIRDERMVCRYKLADGKPAERTQEEMDEDFAARPAPTPTMEDRLAALESENAQLKEALDLLLSGATEEEVTEDA